MRKTAVIVAGGIGQRMGSHIPKQFMELQNKPLIWYTLDTFLRAYEDLSIVLVLPETHIELGKKVAESLHQQARIQFTTGGTTRFHSVKNGLQLVQSPSVIMVHDAVRCLVSVPLIHRCCKAALIKGTAIPSVASTDSVRIVNGQTNQSADRQKVRVIQTPQTFLSDILLPAFNQPYQESFTDEATVVESFGVPVFLTEGEYENIKITRPVDMILASSILQERMLHKP
jgi:2-C-methyl-D-erythritol 4-phosphate cytidylyltransferase